MDICRLTEQVIFTDPYYSAPVNRHTSPQLDDLADAFQHDVAAKAAITALKVQPLPIPCSWDKLPCTSAHDWSPKLQPV